MAVPLISADATPDTQFLKTTRKPLERLQWSPVTGRTITSKITHFRDYEFLSAVRLLGPRVWLQAHLGER